MDGVLRVEQCIAWCHQHGVRDGEAYLLEHFLGDYSAAMQLHVTNIDEYVLFDGMHVQSITS